MATLFPFRGRTQSNTGEEDPEPKNFQTWQLLNLTFYDDEMIRADIDLSTRWFDDSTRLGVGYVNPQFYWKATPWMEAGLGYFFAEVQPEAYDDYSWEQRIIPMCNFKVPIEEWVSFCSRDWFEWRFFENKSDTLQRFRVRPQFNFYPKGWGWDLGPLEYFYLNNEFFFSLQGRVIQENRLTPFGMVFKINDGVSLNVFYMLRGDKLPDGHWEPTNVLGTYVHWTL